MQLAAVLLGCAAAGLLRAPRSRDPSARPQEGAPRLPTLAAREAPLRRCVSTLGSPQDDGGRGELHTLLLQGATRKRVQEAVQAKADVRERAGGLDGCLGLPRVSCNAERDFVSARGTSCTRPRGATAGSKPAPSCEFMEVDFRKL